MLAVAIQSKNVNLWEQLWDFISLCKPFISLVESPSSKMSADLRQQGQATVAQSQNMQLFSPVDSNSSCSYGWESHFLGRKTAAVGLHSVVDRGQVTLLCNASGPSQVSDEGRWDGQVSSTLLQMSNLPLPSANTWTTFLPATSLSLSLWYQVFHHRSAGQCHSHGTFPPLRFCPRGDVPAQQSLMAASRDSLPLLLDGLAQGHTAWQRQE